MQYNDNQPQGKSQSFEQGTKSILDQPTYKFNSEKQNKFSSEDNKYDNKYDNKNDFSKHHKFDFKDWKDYGNYHAETHWGDNWGHNGYDGGVVSPVSEPDVSSMMFLGLVFIGAIAFRKTSSNKIPTKK